MKKFALAVALMSLSCVAVYGEDAPRAAASKPSALDRLPEAVRKAALKEAGDNKISGIEKETKDGKPVWAIEWVVNGKETEIFVAEDGTIVDRQTRERPSMPRPPSRQDIRAAMKDVCKLTDEQAAKMKAVDDAWDKDAAKWQADNAPKVQAGQKALLEAVQKSDGKAMFQAWQQMNEAKAPFEALYQKACADVLAAMTAEQQAAWREHAAMKSIDAWFARAKLTDEQRSAVKAAYAELAKDKQAKGNEAIAGLADKARDLLTKEQLATLSPFMMKMERSIRIGPDSQPSSVPASQVRSGTNVSDDGMLSLDASKIAPGATIVIGGGWGSVMGPVPAAGNNITLPDSD